MESKAAPTFMNAVHEEEEDLVFLRNSTSWSRGA